MDDLLKVAGSVMKSFDPKTDSADDFESIKDGEYNCLLEEINHKVASTGNNGISFTFNITDGEYAGRFIWVNYWFNNQEQKQVKRIMKLAYEFGYELPLEAFSSLDTLVEALQDLCGTCAVVKQTTSKSGYTNYSITQA